MVDMNRVATALVREGTEAAGPDLCRRIRDGLDGAAPALLLVFASPKQPLGEVIAPLREVYPACPILGATTAGEFTQDGDAKESAVAFAVAGDFKVFAGLGVGLKTNVENAVRTALEGLPTHVEGYPHRVAFLLLDPLSGNGEETALLASEMLGSDVRLAGGAAGDDLAMKATMVSCGAKVAGDAVAIAVVFSKSPVGIGVSHGHEPLSSPLTVTRAEANVVYEIDGRPAWDVWLEQTRGRALERGIDADKLTETDLIGYLLRYEAGLSLGEGFKIRAPLARLEGGALSFACGIPQGAVIRITESVAEKQIESARRAARLAREQVGGKVSGAVVFDCICRNLILGETFEQAVTGISEELGGAQIAGFETYGEIALNTGDMSGFHNTTTVVVAFPA
jgi:hypothetical protein